MLPCFAGRETVKTCNKAVSDVREAHDSKFGSYPDAASSAGGLKGPMTGAMRSLAQRSSDAHRSAALNCPAATRTCCKALRMLASSAFGRLLRLTVRRCEVQSGLPGMAGGLAHRRQQQRLARDDLHARRRVGRPAIPTHNRRCATSNRAFALVEVAIDAFFAIAPKTVRWAENTLGPHRDRSASHVRSVSAFRGLNRRERKLLVFGVSNSQSPL